MKASKEWILKHTDKITTKEEGVNVKNVIESAEQNEYETSLSPVGLELVESGRLNNVTEKFEVFIKGLGWCDCYV